MWNFFIIVLRIYPVTSTFYKTIRHNMHMAGLSHSETAYIVNCSAMDEASLYWPTKSRVRTLQGILFSWRAVNWFYSVIFKSKTCYKSISLSTFVIKKFGLVCRTFPNDVEGPEYTIKYVICMYINTTV